MKIRFRVRKLVTDEIIGYESLDYGRWKKRLTNGEISYGIFDLITGYTREQSTNLRDRDRKEIFVGDMLNIYGTLCEIKYDKGRASFIGIDDKGEEHHPSYWFDSEIVIKKNRGEN